MNERLPCFLHYIENGCGFKCRLEFYLPYDIISVNMIKYIFQGKNKSNGHAGMSAGLVAHENKTTRRK